MPMIDLIGQHFDRWTVISRAENSPHGGAQWLCRCECGNTSVVQGGTLKNGRSKSCGCYHREFIAERNRTHGESPRGHKTPEYLSWQAMHRRCSNPNFKNYHRYGGRGIRVCKRWNTFENFLADMGRRPKLSFTLDRYPNHNGNYTPTNCRWATKKQQGNNRKQRSKGDSRLSK
jgi:hypothetical protein